MTLPSETTWTSAPGAAGQSERREVFPAHPRTLLVADDEHLVAVGVANNLRDMGYEVLEPVPDGDRAVDACRRLNPDMALLDIRMPKKGGLEVAETLFRELRIPVVIFSAYSDAEYVDMGNRVGVFGYLLKPVTQDQLRVGISVAWGRFLDFMALDGEVDKLKERLESRKLVEQAKWIIVKRKGISEPDAMKLLQRQARNNRRPLIEVARSVIENEELFAAE
jgi:response regulator NasT